MRRMIVTVLALVPNLAQAGDWQVVQGADIALALAARVVGYEDGSAQNFFADGRTLYEVKGGESWGKWRVEGDTYCSVWPPSEHWECYGVEKEVAGIGIRFVAKDGALTIGKYVDLH